jgi:hypothetical protein
MEVDDVIALPFMKDDDNVFDKWPAVYGNFNAQLFTRESQSQQRLCGQHS